MSGFIPACPPMSNKYHRKPVTPDVSPQRPRDARIRPDARLHLDPLGYDHPYPSMDEFAKRLALRTDAVRTRLYSGQWRAVEAILHCRTPAMGGQVYGCPDCGGQRFAWHSCNHKSCPQCGADATARWVRKQLDRRVKAPHFMVTFTLPDTLREIFLGALAKEAFDIFFRAVAAALEKTLASPKSMGAATSGFTMILHTWNQKLLVHPHIHCIVPGAGLDADGGLIKVKDPRFLAPLPILRTNFRRAFRREMKSASWQVDPAVWRLDWGVHVQPCGDGAAAVKYLGAYVAKSAIGDARMVSMDNKTVSFRWKDRSRGDAMKVMTVEGVEFVRRYLRHALPKGMRSIRYVSIRPFYLWFRYTADESPGKFGACKRVHEPAGTRGRPSSSSSRTAA